MESLYRFIPEYMVHNIGWTLIHWLWQGLAGVILLWIVLAFCRRSSARLRYCLALGTMAILSVAPVGTYLVTAESAPKVIEYNQPTMDTQVRKLEVREPYRPPARIEQIETGVEFEVPEAGILEQLRDGANYYMPYGVIAWLAGVVTLGIWHLGGAWQLRRLRRLGTSRVPKELTELTKAIAAKMGIKRSVEIFGSALVQVPTVIGWLKPLILIPATAISGLDEVQLQALITHELAHIKRYDYIVNIFQVVVETLGFYHPGIWWISRQVRNERENCCDDIAVSVIESRKEYAAALFTMEGIRHKQLELAIAANGGKLINRIERLAGKESSQNRSWLPSVVTAMLLLTMGVGLSAYNNVSAEATENASITTESEPTFESIYSLADGENIKLISRPFTTGRNEFIKEHKIPDVGDDGIVFAWDNNKLVWQTAGRDKQTSLWEVLNSIGLTNARFNGSDEVLDTIIDDGDWLVRTGISEKEKLDGLKAILKEKFDIDVSFEKVTQMSTLITVGGTFEENADREKDEDWPNGKIVFSCTEEIFAPGTFHFYTQTVKDLMLAIENTTGIKTSTIEELENTPIKVWCRFADNSYIFTMPEIVTKSTKLQQLLINLEKQTGLKFRVDKMPVSRWIVNSGENTNSYDGNYFIHKTRKAGATPSKLSASVVFGPIKQVSIETRLMNMEELDLGDLNLPKEQLHKGIITKTVPGNTEQQNDREIELSLYNPINDQQVKALIGQAKKNTKSSLMTAPHVTVFDNEAAYINFSRDIVSVTEESTQTATNLTSGIEINITPQTQEDKSIRCTGFFKICAVNVNTDQKATGTTTTKADIDFITKPGQSVLVIIPGEYLNNEQDKSDNATYYIVFTPEIIQTEEPAENTPAVTVSEGSEDTPLNIAVKNGDTKSVKQLINAGANVNETSTKYDKTPLMMAARDGSTEIVQLLIQAGADVNKQTSELGSTALLYAAEKNNTAIAKLLINAGADTNAAMKIYGITPLIFAADNGNIEIVKMLLEAGVDTEAEATIYAKRNTAISVTTNLQIKTLLAKYREMPKGRAANNDTNSLIESYVKQEEAKNEFEKNDKQTFYNTYALAENENLRLVSPPFVDERMSYYKGYDYDQWEAIPEGPTHMTFYWDGEELSSEGCGFSCEKGQSLESVITWVIKVSSSKIIGDSELLGQLIEGDWVIRKGTSEEELLSRLHDIILEKMGIDVAINLVDVECDCVIAEGTYAHTPIESHFDDSNLILYSDVMDEDEGSGGTTADTVHKMVKVLGDITGITFIDNTTNSEKEIHQSIYWNSSSWLKSEQDTTVKESKLKLLLANTSKQTGLKFRMEKRLEMKWLIYDKAKYGNDAEALKALMPEGKSVDRKDARPVGGMGGFRPGEGDFLLNQNNSETVTADNEDVKIVKVAAGQVVVPIADELYYQRQDDKIINSYKLRSGEKVRRIAPPYSSQRHEFYMANDKSRTAKGEEAEPAYYSFIWDGKLSLNGMGFIPDKNNSLLNVMTSCLNIPLDRFCGNVQTLYNAVPGDWVMCAGLSYEQRIGELERILKDELNMDIHFEKMPATVERVRISGEYNFSPMAGMEDDNSLYLYSNKDTAVFYNSIFTDNIGNVSDLANGLSELFKLEVYTTEATGKQLISQKFRPSYAAVLSKISDKNIKSIQLKLLLENLARQTGLTFTIEKEEIDKWYLVDNTAWANEQKPDNVIDGPDSRGYLPFGISAYDKGGVRYTAENILHPEIVKSGRCTLLATVDYDLHSLEGILDDVVNSRSLKEYLGDDSEKARDPNYIAAFWLSSEQEKAISELIGESPEGTTVSSRSIMSDVLTDMEWPCNYTDDTGSNVEVEQKFSIKAEIEPRKDSDIIVLGVRMEFTNILDFGKDKGRPEREARTIDTAIGVREGQTLMLILNEPFSQLAYSRGKIDSSKSYSNILMLKPDIYINKPRNNWQYDIMAKP